MQTGGVERIARPEVTVVKTQADMKNEHSMGRATDKGKEDRKTCAGSISNNSIEDCYANEYYVVRCEN